MYIYRIVEDEINEELEDGFASDFTYITHDNKYSEEEFINICNQAYKLVGNEIVYSFKLIRVLCEKFGFKQLEPIATFQYETR